MDDYERLGAGPCASVVSALDFLQWGEEVVLHCLYDPSSRRPYELSFKNCKDVRLEPLEDIPEAALIGIALGTAPYQKPAIITTDAFELSVLYEKWDLKWT